eukprot:g3011.t1
MQRAHRITAHHELVKNDTDCFICRRTLRDPVRLPPCASAHHACICLQCFLSRFKRGQLNECPVCLADLTELPLLLGKEEGFRQADLRKADVEALIDDARKAQADAHELQEIRIKYERENELKLSKVQRREHRAQLIEVKRLVEQERLAQRSEALHKEDTLAKESLLAARLREANRRSQLKLELTQSRILSPDNDHHRKKGRDQRARSTSSLAYFEKLDRDRRLAKEKHEKVLALKANQAAETNSKKLALERRAAHKQRQFEIRAKHIEDKMRSKLEARQQALLEKREAARERIAKARQKFNETAEARVQKHQENSAKAEIRMRMMVQRKFEETQAMAKLRESVSRRRLHMLEQHQLMQNSRAEELLAKFADQDRRREDRVEESAAERQRIAAEKSEMRGKKMQHCAKLLECERLIKVDLANELEEKTAAALAQRANESARALAEAVARGKRKDARSQMIRMEMSAERHQKGIELEQSSIDRLAKAETRRQAKLADSVDRRKRYLEEVAKRKAIKDMHAPEMNGRRIQLSHKQSLEAILKAQPQKKGHD